VRRFKDVDAARTTLLELRGDGGQTVFPDSLHESGERVRFDADGAPAAVGADLLRAAVEQLAATTLPAPPRPRPHRSRPDRLPVPPGGMPPRGGPAPDAAATIPQTAAAGAGDEEARDRGAAVASTADALAAGRAATGRPRCVEVLGAPVVARLTEWLSLRPEPRGDARLDADAVPAGGAVALVPLATVRPASVRSVRHR